MIFVSRKRNCVPTDEKKLMEKLESMKCEAKKELEKCSITKEQLMSELTDQEAQLMGAIPPEIQERILNRLGIR